MLKTTDKLGCPEICSPWQKEHTFVHSLKQTRGEVV